MEITFIVHILHLKTSFLQLLTKCFSDEIQIVFLIETNITKIKKTFHLSFVLSIDIF